MTTNLKSFFFALAMAVFLGLGCQEDPSLPEFSSPDGPQALVQGQGGAIGDDGNCLGVGEEYNFTLQQAGEDDNEGATIPQGMSYRAYLGATPPYLVGEFCLCKLEYYTLEFDHLPTASLILLEDALGQTIPFSGPFQTLNGTSQYIKISKYYLQTSVFVGFDPGVSPLPRLKETGGLCIVDNISAPDGERLQTIPHQEYAYDAVAGLEYTAIFLPVDGTDGMVP